MPLSNQVFQTKRFSLTLSVVESDPFRAQEAIKCQFQSGEDWFIFKIYSTRDSLIFLERK